MKKQAKIPVFNQYQTVSPATKLLEKRRKMYQIHEAFQIQKQQFRNQQLKFKEDEDKLKSRDQQLQNQLINFCQFLQENQSKRKKAEQRFKMEQKAFLQKQRQLKELKDQIDRLTKSQKIYANRVNNLRKYEEYLEKVRTTYSDQYPEMSDILNRYNTLTKSTNDLIEKTKVLELNHEQLKRKALNEQKQLNQSILTINNELKELSRRIEERTSQKNELQSELQKSNQQFSNKNLNLGKIFMAIDNLSDRCNENSYRLKHEFDEKIIAQKKQTNKKKIENETTAKHDDEIGYEHKSKQAATKLKQVLSHMKDFKAIIDEYRLQLKHNKAERAERY